MSFDCLVICMQVRLGTERGSVVVKWAVMTLYSLLFAIGLSRALPLSCIVSQYFNDEMYSSSIFSPAPYLL